MRRAASEAVRSAISVMVQEWRLPGARQAGGGAIHGWRGGLGRSRKGCMTSPIRVIPSPDGALTYAIPFPPEETPAVTARDLLGAWEAARGAAFLRYAAAAGRLAFRLRPDLVVASSTPLTVALPALLAKALRGIPFIFEIRDPWPELPRAMRVLPKPFAPVLEALANLACRQAEAVVALSEGMAETARARGADPARVQVIGNGCDLDLFGPHIAPWRPAEATAWEVLALYAGAHGRANGLGVVVEAARLLAKQGERRLRILLVGEGAEKTALMEQARGLQNVTFLPPMPKRDVARLFAGSQIALHILADCPAFAEWTAPNKLMDGLAAGRPAISNAPAQAARLLAESGCGIAVPPGDAAGLAAALMSLVGNPARREAMGQAARGLAVRRYDRRLLAARFVGLVESL